MSLTNPDHDVVGGDSGQSVEVSLAAHDQEPVIANLFELYAYDLSQIFDLHIGPDGRYGYPSLPLYWKEASRFPLLIKVDGYLAGFALVSRGSLISGHRDIWDMAEFFVLKKYRRMGVGATATHDIWRRFSGRWEVRVVETNRPAQMFWQAAIHSFTGVAIQPVHVEQRGLQRLCFAFDCAGATAPNKALQPTCEDARD
jgi:predicted acetyltransferase